MILLHNRKGNKTEIRVIQRHATVANEEVISSRIKKEKKKINKYAKIGSAEILQL